MGTRTGTRSDFPGFPRSRVEDPVLAGNDENGRCLTFYEFVIFDSQSICLFCLILKTLKKRSKVWVTKLRTKKMSIL